MRNICECKCFWTDSFNMFRGSLLLWLLRYQQTTNIPKIFSAQKHHFQFPLIVLVIKCPLHWNQGRLNSDRLYRTVWVEVSSWRVQWTLSGERKVHMMMLLLLQVSFNGALWHQRTICRLVKGGFALCLQPCPEFGDMWRTRSVMHQQLIFCWLVLLVGLAANVLAHRTPAGAGGQQRPRHHHLNDEIGEFRFEVGDTFRIGYLHSTYYFLFVIFHWTEVYVNWVVDYDFIQVEFKAS